MPVPQTTTRIVALSILLFLEALIAGILPITQEGKWPSQIQIFTVLLVAVAAVVTYLIPQFK